MSELLRLFHNYSEEKIEKIIKEIIRKQIPIGQTIGDTTIPFDETLNLSDSFLVILYLRSEPVDTNTLLKFNSDYYPNDHHPILEDTPKVLKKLKIDRYILGETYNDFVITEKGIKYVEEKLLDKILPKINL